MKKYITLLFFISLSFISFAQSWLQVNNNPLTKSGRTRNKGFSINGTGYVLGGSDASIYYGTEAWAYDTATKSWTAIALYPDANGDDGKASVAVDSLGYAGLGGTAGFNWTNSWFSYSKTQNKWTALTPFPGAARAYSATFTIAGEIYVAGGMNGANNHGFDDFYKYDPPTDRWRRIGNCPALGVNFSAVAFSIGGKGYVCTGALIDSLNGTMTTEDDVWEYDPTDSTWAQKNSFPGGARTEAIGWATCDKGYLGGGYAVHSPQTLDSDFWEYTPASDTWKQIANYGGGNLNGAATFVIGKTGYVCGGQRDSANYQQARGYVWTNDDWSYTKIYTPTFSVNPSAAVCAGQKITFTDTSNYSPENWYWQFPGGKPDTSTSNNPTVEYDTTGVYNITLTAWNSCDSGTQTYTNYVTVGAGGVLTIMPQSPIVCGGQSIKLIIKDTGSNFTWSPANGLSASTGDSVTATPSVTMIYLVTGTGSQGCQSTGTDTVKIDSAPAFLILPQPPPTFCNGQSATLKISGGGDNFTWSPSAGLNATTGDSVIAGPTVSTTYTVMGTDSSGCTASGTEAVNVILSPNKPTFYQHGDTLISSSKYDNQWYRNDTLLQNDTSQDLIITALGHYWVNVNNEANGCSTTSDTVKIDSVTGINQLALIKGQLLIYPNPINDRIFIKINSSVENVKDWNLQITDVLGRTVYSQPMLNYNNDIDLSGLSGGVYFIAVISKTGKAIFPVVRVN